MKKNDALKILTSVKSRAKSFTNCLRVQTKDKIQLAQTWKKQMTKRKKKQKATQAASVESGEMCVRHLPSKELAEKLDILKAQKIQKTEFFSNRARSTKITGSLTIKKYTGKLRKFINTSIQRKVKTVLLNKKQNPLNLAKRR